uniref:Uncharacterized protein TCIL3000_11_12680 n=1 Tax=Trypanosoma congolense (strain IL3000) TaxID=1068625 RepID=G0V2A0_TRYCI|nr:unnamed protein product [Trypanosoma congolense IL3000]
MIMEDSNSDNASPLEYIRSNPSTALSARWVFDLPDDQQEQCVISMIQNAAFYETWMSYFEYTERKGITVTEDVALEAIHSVGLDPYSAPLWLKVINIVDNDQRKRDLFHMALQVPLYQQTAIYNAYKTFESDFAERNGGATSDMLAYAEVAHFSEILQLEPHWPDRFVDTSRCSSYHRSILCTQWNNLLQVLLSECEQDVLRDLHLRRTELAFRQMCSQFPSEDVCWHVYACFVAIMMDDRPQALEILEKGRVYTKGDSTALWLVEPILREDSSLAERMPKSKIGNQMLFQRLLAEAARDTLHIKKRLRDIGKGAVANSISDWRIYQQWASIERCVFRDSSMTSKIYERGTACVSKSFKDTVLLSNEAVRYHLWRQDERQVVGYSELQIEQLSSSRHNGLVKASWNSFVNAESAMGLPSLLKTIKRRAEQNNELSHKSIIERYRVGNYIPCSSEDLDWIEFVDDLTKTRREEQEHILHMVTPAKYVGLSIPPSDKFRGSMPDVSLWCPVALSSKFEESPIQDPEEVAGPRYLRGRLVYNVVVDEKTASRLRREELMRKNKDTCELQERLADHTQGALQILVERLNTKKLNDAQLLACRHLSPEWLMGTLARGDLDLSSKRT